MIFRLIVIAAVIGLGYYIFNYIQVHNKCQKCDGKGYWRAMRGEKEKCDMCKGTGKISKGK